MQTRVKQHVETQTQSTIDQAFVISAEYGNLDIMYILLPFVSALNCVNEEDRTALMLALEYDQHEVVMKLRQLGCPINLLTEDIDGESVARYFAAYYKRQRSLGTMSPVNILNRSRARV